MRSSAKADFVELTQLEELIDQLGTRTQVEVVERIHHQGREFPIYSLVLGSMRDDVPVLAFFGGVHGLEKIGSEVILSYLNTLTQLLDWDEELNERLERSRLVFMPIVNPVGVFQGTRSNGNGVDLMRNAPIDGTGNIKLYSGHRLSPKLPWYRGDGAEMETEARALCRVVEKHLFNAPLSIALDLHSGFGIHDRLWFPYASIKQAFPGIAEAHALKTLFDRCYPNHFYKIEPMSQEYVINGDLWDYLYDSFMQARSPHHLFMPLTLEMGSWLWLRKSPLHLFQRHGLFHPLLPHRHQRILRRHFTLFDFLYRSLLSPGQWAKLNTDRLDHHRQQAMKLWYG
ncbi:M14 family zinc carboxypeptidase [Methylomonas rapida]|uniref:M14 family zinc carboxypeptidase n=1 Tax=Methylomonas rapida TaxID=2963939 RepID=A0ABY7GFI1_9GAMM|nr:M14 family zinc carboxypeptidase [Methylomonas rapida]WAR43221.1 M14 family zinc carboxypeptidase [Methylomonas rapida]